jgi:elongation factor Tu
MRGEMVMIISDVMNITGRGVVALGQIQNITIKIGDCVVIDPEYTSEIVAEVIGIEAFRKMLKFAEPGQIVGLILKGVEKKDLKKKMKIYQIKILN